MRRRWWRIGWRRSRSRCWRAAMNRPVQVVNGGVYLRGLLEQGARKSLEPMVDRLGGDADYQSLQQFLADSPWDPGLVVQGGR